MVTNKSTEFPVKFAFQMNSEQPLFSICPVHTILSVVDILTVELLLHLWGGGKRKELK